MRRQVPPVAKQQRRQSERRENARSEEARLGEKTQEPAQINAVGPVGYGNLVAGDKTERGANAVNGGPISQPLYYIMSELFLRPAADGNQDMGRAALLEERKKMSILDLQSVARREIAIVDLDWESFATRPIR